MKYKEYFAPILGSILGGVSAVVAGIDAGGYAEQLGASFGTLAGLLFNSFRKRLAGE